MEFPAGHISSKHKRGRSTEGIDAFIEKRPPVWTGRKGGAFFSANHPSRPGVS